MLTCDVGTLESHSCEWAKQIRFEWERCQKVYPHDRNPIDWVNFKFDIRQSKNNKSHIDMQALNYFDNFCRQKSSHQRSLVTSNRCQYFAHKNLILQTSLASYFYSSSCLYIAPILHWSELLIGFLDTIWNETYGRYH